MHVCATFSFIGPLQLPVLHLGRAVSVVLFCGATVAGRSRSPGWRLRCSGSGFLQGVLADCGRLPDSDQGA